MFRKAAVERRLVDAKVFECLDKELRTTLGASPAGAALEIVGLALFSRDLVPPYGPFMRTQRPRGDGHRPPSSKSSSDRTALGESSYHNAIRKLANKFARQGPKEPPKSQGDLNEGGVGGVSTCLGETGQRERGRAA